MSRTSTYLNFARNTEEAFRFYSTVFGNECTGIMRFRDNPAQTGTPQTAEADLNLLIPVQNLQLFCDLVGKKLSKILFLGIPYSINCAATSSHILSIRAIYHPVHPKLVCKHSKSPTPKHWRERHSNFSTSTERIK